MSRLSSRITIALVGVFFLLGLLTLTQLGLGLDEAYYWYWAKHPDLGYVDHPPMIAWVIGLSSALGGDSPLFVRLGGFLLLWGGFAFAFGALRQLFPDAGAGVAWGYLLVLNLTLIFPGAAIIQTIDTPLFAFWMAALYFGARVVTHAEAKAWYGIGVSLGLGMLSKYTMVLFAPCLLLFLLFTPSQRYWLGRKEPWLSALLALLVFSPVLLWNSQHDWISFTFQLNQGFAASEQSVLEKMLRYVLEQAAIISPLLFLAFLFYAGWGSYQAVTQNNKADRYLMWLSWPVLLFFAYTTARGAQAEANWPAPAYIAGLMLAWVTYQRHFASVATHRRSMQLALALSLLLSLLLRIHLITPILPLPPADDRMREFTGWEALGRDIEDLIAAHPSASGWFIAGDKGTIVAEAVYHTGNRYTGIDFALPQRYLFLDAPNTQLKGKNALIIAKSAPATLARFQPYFERVTPLAPYTHRYRGEDIAKHSKYLYLGESFRGNWQRFDALKQR
jgi:4-amino-4-deoxy-L-arabinose transferase-like glycosyltransferase